MQAQCPTCSQRIVVDDSRVPDRAFSVRCPKCQSPVKLPGRSGGSVGSAAAAPSTPTSLPVPVPAQAEPPRSAATSSSAPSSQELPPEVMAQLRREIRKAESSDVRARVLVALSDHRLAEPLTLALGHLGYEVQALEEIDGEARLLEQGLYEIVITSRSMTLPGRTETLAQRVGRLGPDLRRQTFLALVGEEFKTGDGTQAFVALADLVIHPRDVASAEGVLLGTLAERTRLYRPFLDARKGLDAGLG